MAVACVAAGCGGGGGGGGGGGSSGRMLGQQQQQQQQLYSSAALLTGERSRLLTCYVQDYLECVESLPHDMQRNVSVLRELDNKYQGRGRGSSTPTRGPGTVARSLPQGKCHFSSSPRVYTVCVGVWHVGPGAAGPRRWGSRPSPFPRCGLLVWGGLRVEGSGGRPSAPAADPAAVAAVKTKSAIFKQQAHLFRVFARRVPQTPRRSGPGSVQPGGGGTGAVGSERPAAAGLPRAHRAGLPSAQPASGPHPLSADALERAGGEGARADCEGGLRGGPSPGGPELRARESSLPPSPAPGKVPGRSLSRLLQPNG